MRIYRIRKFPARLAILVLVITTVIFSPRILRFVRGAGLEIVARPFKFFGEMKSSLVCSGDLSEENLLLKQRLGAMSVTLARMKETEIENERLKDLLGVKKRQRYSTVAASVIARDPSDWRKSIIIDKGKADGIKEGMACATAKGLIGRVSEAGISSSKVMLITDPNSRVGVILESSRESGILIGSPQGVCKVIYLSLDEKIKTKDRVVTAGFGKALPKGLAIGEVASAGVDKANLYKYVTIKTFEDMNKIEEVLCIDARD